MDLSGHTNIVYSLAKQAWTYIKIIYCLKLRNYNNDECFIELCASIIDDIEKDNVNCFNFIFVSFIICIIMLLFLLYLT
jgi:hypothetical protein